MRTEKISENIYLLTANDRRTHLFENLWPIENGVAYNSYLIVDEKIVLIDTIDRHHVDDFVTEVTNLIPAGRKLDYLIINHMEPDHSSAIRDIVKIFPEVSIVGNKMTFSLLKDFYGTFQQLHLVKDEDILEIGKIRLKFYFTPWLHWPETMMTYDETNKILFSADAFGSFGTLDGGIFDDEIDTSLIEDEMLRYYSNIVGKYSKMAQKALSKLELLEIRQICSTHGPIWRTDLSKLINLYQKWTSYEAQTGVVIVYGSMYGNTAKMADFIARQLVLNGIKNVKVYDSSKTHASYIIRDIWKYRGAILGSSAYNAGVFPAMESLITKLKNLELENRYVATFGSSGWNKAGVKGLNKWIEEMKWQTVETSAETKGTPDIDALQQCEIIAKKMANMLKLN